MIQHYGTMEDTILNVLRDFEVLRTETWCAFQIPPVSVLR